MKLVEVRSPGGLENLAIGARPQPVAAAGEVVVRWYATSLNHHDLSIALGRTPTEDRRIPMSDGAGEVVEVGAGVTRWQVGDRVMSLFFPDWLEGPPTAEKTARMSGDRIDGCAIEYAAVAERSVTRIPAGYDFAEAATLPCAALTAWRALVPVAAIKAGNTVLVEGTSGMSIFALQLARASGANVFATTSSSAKADRLKALGACAVLNYRDEPEWGERIRELTGGGVDCVLDVGGASTLDQSIKASRIGGHVISIGVMGGADARVFVPRLLFNHQRISGIAVGSGSMQEARTDVNTRTRSSVAISRRWPSWARLRHAPISWSASVWRCTTDSRFRVPWPPLATSANPESASSPQPRPGAASKGCATATSFGSAHDEELREHLGVVFRRLAHQKECGIEVGHL